MELLFALLLHIGAQSVCVLWGQGLFGKNGVGLALDDEVEAAFRFKKTVNLAELAVGVVFLAFQLHVHTIGINAKGGPVVLVVFAVLFQGVVGTAAPTAGHRHQNHQGTDDEIASRGNLEPVAVQLKAKVDGTRHTQHPADDPCHRGEGTFEMV